MRYVQINSFYNGSTGTIMRNLHHDLQEKGIESFIFWGRRHETINDHEQCIASRAGVYSHGGLARFMIVPVFIRMETRDVFWQSWMKSDLTLCICITFMATTLMWRSYLNGLLRKTVRSFGRCTIVGQLRDIVHTSSM